ncbi:hypothetical protein J6I82_15000 [Acinetobacter baumannii]|uniref:Lipoprotein n=1 Tax=Acinetobacter baumannii TaxID=470 RepID=A0A0J8TTQ7_ACIBA|nr:hypothetical protein [Acinetobacter baumannii]EKX9478242.1 hypothetical protein [Acinetobacter baumannii]KAB0455456.1 hypothetical protein EG248_04660 [Acinetobacter baumannii]KMV12818.1 putative lipoprotein [Acinetobacter baumannii]MCA4426078.1 hypothetical protein [Acinetobacter baumannii]MCG6618147.1 hypothetical protein [Acinetobacter baumannii]
MKKIIGIFLFSLILVGCGKSAEDIAKEKQAQEQALKIKQEQERKLKEQAELKKVEDAVRYYLKDGDSAKFRNVIKNCGEVNAKNSWGAYAGFTRFIVQSDKDVVFEDPDNAYFDFMVKMTCHKDYLAKFPVETSEEIAIDASPTEQIPGVAAVAAAGETLENETRSVSKPKKEEVAVEELATEDTTSDTGSSENY